MTLLAHSQNADSFNPNANGAVHAIAVQPDGKKLIGGEFTAVGGQTASRIARLREDGSLDSEFSSSADSSVFSVAVQEDGKILVGGWFLGLVGQLRPYLGRLNPDGSLDQAFNPNVGGGGSFPGVYSVALQRDGKILVAGDFRALGGASCTNIGRLNANGTRDSNFVASANNIVYPLAVQADGKIVVAGDFTTLCGQPRLHIGRLNADGTLDSSFNPGMDSTPVALRIQTNGQILVGGGFMSLAGTPRSRLGRLNSNGSLDLLFNPGASDVVRSLLLQADGKILVGGAFTNLAGAARSRIGRLNPDGTIDETFNPAASGVVYSLTLQPDGRVLAGGSFGMVGGQPRNGIGRLTNNIPVVNSLTADISGITWLRGGSSPELSAVAVDTSTNGVNWTNAGAASRTSDGWLVAGVTVTSNMTVRARGFVVSGRYNASGWFEERGLGPPVILSQPLTRTNKAGTDGRFGARAVGSESLYYQWLWNGTNLVDGGRISGAQTPSLTISNTAGMDIGGYSLFISNSFGVATSLVANLVVIDPVITTQLVDQAINAGAMTTLTLGAAGADPLNFLWRRNGEYLQYPTGRSLVISNAGAADAGMYDVIVSNQFGSVTSVVARLTVNASLLDGFDPVVDAQVSALALTLDEKVIIGGAFASVAGQPRMRLAKLEKDGSLDANFNPGVSGGSGIVNCLGIQTDGRIVVGGSFTSLGGQSCLNLGRLNPDGTLDTNFNYATDGAVNCLTLQLDGSLLIAGSFGVIGGQYHPRVARIQPNGLVDPAFDPAPNTVVYCAAVQADGSVLLGGNFTTVGGQSRNRIARVRPDGTVDTFNPGANAEVYAINVRPDGNILVGGNFVTLGGQTRKYVGLLDPSGALVSSFNPGSNGPIYTVCQQSDGKTILGGRFTYLGGQGRPYIARLSNDGSLDLTSNPQASNYVYGVALQRDGGILVAGTFTGMSSQLRGCIGRLQNTSSAVENLAISNGTITWLRTGSCPEAAGTIFEISTNSTDWVTLGVGTRTPSGWQLSNLVLTAGAMLRARAAVSGGIFGGSSWYVQSTTLVPSLDTPTILTNAAFSLGHFSFDIVGTSGKVVVVESGMDLLNWFPLETNLLGSNSVHFTDPETWSFQRRFYRARVQSP